MEIGLYRYYILLPMLVMVLFTSSCRDDEDLPPEPVITEMWFDSADNNLMIRFTDGDGDFGLDSEDIDPPFQALNEDGTPNFFHYNMHVDAFFKEDGEWELVPLDPESIGLKFRVPDITPAGQNKQLRVLITWNIEGNINEYRSMGLDTIKFEAVLVDRALNVSLPAETEPLVLTP